MALTWWWPVLIGLVLLAGCVAAALLRPGPADRRTLRPLANVDRLTRLPEYVRAVRRRGVAVLVTLTLLAVAFGAALLVTARPSGLPGLATDSETAAPQDIMVCVGGPVEHPEISTALGEFAEQIESFGTERIGLTSANRRVVPMTRDYHYAAGQFAGYAQAQDSGRELEFVAPVVYSDYRGTVEDVLGICLTGFPGFEEPAASRRSLIYLGPATFENSDGASLFTSDQIAELAAAAGVQVNALTIGAGSPFLDHLAAATGGLSAIASAVPEQIAEIRSHPPDSPEQATKLAGTETPELPIIVALLAVLGAAAMPWVFRTPNHGRWWIPATAGLLLVVAAVRPVTGHAGSPLPVDAQAPNIVVVLDRSPAMAASEGNAGSRLEQARTDIAAVFESHPDARVAVIEFGTAPALRWPLSADTWSLGPVLEGLQPDPDSPEALARSNAGAAATLLRYQLIGAAQQYPRAPNLVFYFGAGAPGSQVPHREFTLPDGLVDGGAVVGYGTAGRGTLEQVAGQIGVPYRSSPLDVGQLEDAGPGISIPDSAAASSPRTEWYWLPAGLAALLILAELYLGLRSVRRPGGIGGRP